MYTLISILVLIACVLLTLIVLVQNSKGGGLAANFSSSNQIMGVRKTADFLEKATWTLAGALVVLCLLASFALPSRSERADSDSILGTEIENAVDTEGMPLFPSVPTSTPIEETPNPNQ